MPSIWLEVLPGMPCRWLFRSYDRPDFYYPLLEGRKGHTHKGRREKALKVMNFRVLSFSQKRLGVHEMLVRRIWFIPPPWKRAQNEEKLYKSVENPPDWHFLRGGGGQSYGQNKKRFYGHLGVSDSGCFQDVFQGVSGCFRVFSGCFSLCPFWVCPLDPCNSGRKVPLWPKSLHHITLYCFEVLFSPKEKYRAQNCFWELIGEFQVTVCDVTVCPFSRHKRNQRPKCL